MPLVSLLSRIGLSLPPATMRSTRASSSSRLVHADPNQARVREVKRESNVSFDISKSESESVASVKRKRVNRALEVNGEHPKKQDPLKKVFTLAQVAVVPDIEDFRYDRKLALTSSNESAPSLIRLEKKVRVSSIVKGTHKFITDKITGRLR
ncbi:hypothetical protein QOZ80_9AG0677660 [Eleusine coracana subsp. coracana]|nr:hypothetical protein QOZ80_9AG0677660 [Eleusine coracana subsp. coracana]